MYLDEVHFRTIHASGPQVTWAGLRGHQKGFVSFVVWFQSEPIIVKVLVLSFQLPVRRKPDQRPVRGVDQRPGYGGAGSF